MGPANAGGLRDWLKGLPRSNLIWDFDRFGLRSLQLKMLNRHAISGYRVVVAAEFDIFSRNMNVPGERLRRANAMN